MPAFEADLMTLQDLKAGVAGEDSGGAIIIRFFSRGIHYGDSGVDHIVLQPPETALLPADDGHVLDDGELFDGLRLVVPDAGLKVLVKGFPGLAGEE